MITHMMKYKVQIEAADGKKMDRNSPWAHWQNQGNSGLFDCVFWNPKEKYQWKCVDRLVEGKESSIRIYESHVGMAQEGGQVGTYRQYVENILPKIKEAGYNTIQLMAI